MSVISTAETTKSHPEQPANGRAEPLSGEPEILGRERAAVRGILRLVAERSRAEAEIEERFQKNRVTADAGYQQKHKELVETIARLEREAVATDEQQKTHAMSSARDGESKAKAEFASASRQLASEFDRLRQSAKSDLARARSEITAQFDAAQQKTAKDHALLVKPINDVGRLADSVRQRLATVATDYAGKFKLSPEVPPPTPESYEKYTDAPEELFTRLSRMDMPLKLLEGLIIPKSMKGGKEAWVFVVMIGLFAGIAIGMGAEMASVAVAAAVGAVVAVPLRMWLIQLSKSQLERLYVPLVQSLADADGLAAFARGRIDKLIADVRKTLAVKRDDDLKKAQAKHDTVISIGEADRDERIRKINEVYAERMMEVQAKREIKLRSAIDGHERRMTDFRTQSQSKLAKLEAKYRQYKEQLAEEHEAAWNAMAEQWKTGMTQAAAELAEIEKAVDGYCPTWADAGAAAGRALPKVIPPVIRFGTIQLDLASLPGGIAPDARLMEGIPTTFDLPALRAFPGTANLMIETGPEGRGAALGVLQASMFRLLSSLPPGQVRFTIVDPIGIGRNFGAFMHLADFDPALVNQQVWTDARQIEERLAELSVQMEVVTQKYLRNEYATLEEYNAVADEVAEPYRVLVVADFPTRFDEKSAARIAAIASGGVPCGVVVLVAVDSSKGLPSGFGMDELRPYCEHLTWDGSKLVWDDPDFGQFPLKLDTPPLAEAATKQIQRIGAAAKDSRRVEVPFEFIAPAADKWWTLDSRTGIDVPLGKSGATKRHHLALGHGTAQHVLIAGRTGSGKSTLMHALITNLALNYSPDEIDLYLIDFKKGVEFKVYATHELPHASVVAIESEREFGLSVLQRLDAELRLRADKFRDAGVQDVNGYRNAPGTGPLPRIMLIVDEFQEFFVEEDKIAQEAALWLDRLVRQGRAFGIHVLLGSQSLAGAFTLARSTLGQMAVRVALQCSDTDASLILNESNPAPKMLSRPGEAIYNDANGATEGNHFFQVVWLGDARREDYLKRLNAMAAERKPLLARRPIVFEGDSPAELARNPLLRQKFEAPSWADAVRSAPAWLGDAIAIKDPTSALFRRLGGNHVLVVGQNEEAAFGVIVAALVSLASQYAPAESMTVRRGARFYVLDGTPEDHPNAEMLGRVAGYLPHGVRVGGWRDAAGVLAEVAGEVARRQEGNGDGPEIFVFIHDLPKFRELRKKEDDFSFSKSAEDAGPPDHLDAILKEGPGLGVHLMAWCDTVNNLNRYFTHQTLREFAMRVLFQMSPTDSGHMLDGPLASKLGPLRALFHDEEENRLEKFRPYGTPDEGWLREVGERLGRRGG